MAILNEGQTHVEKTLGIIKPNAYAKANEIEQAISGAGFTILRKTDTQLTPEQCGDFYIEHFGKPFYEDLRQFMSSGMVRVLVLAKTKAISEWRVLMGPTDVEQAKIEAPKSLRAKYGQSKGKNAVHGSDSYTSAQREIKFFFPELEDDPTGEITDYLTTEVNPTLLPGLCELYKEEPENPVLWLAQWLKQNPKH